MTILLALVLALVPVWLVRSRGTATQIMAGLIAFPVIAAAFFFGLIWLSQ